MLGVRASRCTLPLLRRAADRVAAGCAARCRAWHGALPAQYVAQPTGGSAHAREAAQALHHHEAVARRDLAAAHTLSSHHGFDELIWNHISARLDAEGNFLVTPGDLHFDEVRASDLVVSSPSNINVTADVIHSMLYKTRPDIGAIVHHHTTAVVAVSALEEGLQYVTQDAAAFYGRVAYYPWEGVSDDYDECERIAATVADGVAHTVILRNHGALTFGATVAEAWVRYYYLDRVCQVQCALSGQRVVQPDAAVLEHAAQQYSAGGGFQHGRLEWAALLRQADRLQARSGR